MTTFPLARALVRWGPASWVPCVPASRARAPGSPPTGFVHGGASDAAPLGQGERRSEGHHRTTDKAGARSNQVEADVAGRSAAHVRPHTDCRSTHPWGRGRPRPTNVVQKSSRPSHKTGNEGRMSEQQPPEVERVERVEILSELPPSRRRTYESERGNGTVVHGDARRRVDTRRERGLRAKGRVAAPLPLGMCSGDGAGAQVRRVMHG
jgi:hypothetical protein